MRTNPPLILNNPVNNRRNTTPFPYRFNAYFSEGRLFHKIIERQSPP